MATPAWLRRLSLLLAVAALALPRIAEALQPLPAGLHFDRPVVEQRSRTAQTHRERGALAGLICDQTLSPQPAPAPARTPETPAPAAITETEARAFGLDQAAAVAASQAVIGQTPNDYALRDQHDRPIRLAQLQGKPLLVNFIYTGCFKVCPTSSRALRKAVDAMRDRFGVDQFQVVSIGFNQPGDTPMALRTFAAQQRIDDPNWVLVAPRSEDVAALARDFGFSYVATPLGFDHTLQVSVLDASGRIHAQVYGDAFGADSLGEPLRKLLTGSLATETRSFADLVDKVRILCSVYDPITGKYRVNYSMYIEIAGGLTFILFMIAFAISEWRARRALRLRALV